MKLARDVQPLTDFEHGAAALVRAVAAERRTVLITDDGRAKAVLMDVASYDQWRNTLAMLQLIAQGEADIEAGRTIPQDEVFDRAEQVIQQSSIT